MSWSERGKGDKTVTYEPRCLSVGCFEFMALETELAVLHPRDCSFANGLNQIFDILTP